MMTTSLQLDTWGRASRSLNWPLVVLAVIASAAITGYTILVYLITRA